MVQVLQERQSQVADIRVERQHLAVTVGLVEHALPAGQRDRMRVSETTHTAHGAEIVVEGTVFLHQHDDMLNVTDGLRWLPSMAAAPAMLGESSDAAAAVAPSWMNRRRRTVGIPACPLGTDRCRQSGSRPAT